MLIGAPIAVEETAVHFVKFSHWGMKRKGMIKKKKKKGFTKFLIISVPYEIFALLWKPKKHHYIHSCLCEENAKCRSANPFSLFFPPWKYSTLSVHLKQEVSVLLERCLMKFSVPNFDFFLPPPWQICTFKSYGKVL